ncbi:MAG: hypothetical protein HZA93_18995 [Verrucomicrobia bacterium]|nr:hypothetical protein [Verrucomicrobiota bacterium]
MIRTIRALFLGRLLREKLLLVAFAAIGALWWLSAFSSRLGAFNLQQRRTTLSLKEQQQWLDNRKAIETSAEKAAAKLEAAKTLDGSRLLATVNTIAREAGLKNTSSGSPNAQSSGQFSIHTLDYTVIRADWESLTKFYAALQQRSPYIGIEHVQITADPTGTQLTLALRVSSVEITR